MDVLSQALDVALHKENKNEKKIIPQLPLFFHLRDGKFISQDIAYHFWDIGLQLYRVWFFTFQNVIAHRLFICFKGLFKIVVFCQWNI